MAKGVMRILMLVVGVVLLLGAVIYYLDSTSGPVLGPEPDDAKEWATDSFCKYRPIDEESWLGMTRRERDDLRGKKAYWKRTGYCSGPPAKDSSSSRYLNSFYEDAEIL